MAKPKIAHIVRQFTPSKGGLEVYVEQLIARQKEKYDIDVMTFNRLFGIKEKLKSFEQRDGFNVRRIGYIGSRQVFLPFLTPSMLKKYEIIHIHATDQIVDLVSFYSRFLPLKFCLTTHGLFFHTQSLKNIKKIYLRTLTKMALKRAFAIFAVSANDAKTLAKVNIESQILRNPIEPVKGVRQNGKDCLYIGRISMNKRVDKLIEWLHHLHKKGDQRTLHIVGSDPESLQSSLKERVRIADLQDYVHFHGFVSEKQLKDLCERSSYCVSASRYEGYGLAMVEGMSAGLLPIMHQNDAFKETHQLSGCGLITDFTHAEKAAQDFIDYDKNLTENHREKARSYAQSQSWDKVIEAINERYQEILAS